MREAELSKNIELAKSGSQIAFKQLLDAFWNLVYGFQLKRTNDEYEAEEITIQTFAKAFDKIETYNSSYKFQTWLVTISKNIHIDLIRSRSLETTRVDHVAERSILDESPTAEDQLINEQNLHKLLSDIKFLKPRYQEVIQLRFFQEMSYRDIAETLQEPLNNVKVKLLRAKKLLAEIIKENT